MFRSLFDPVCRAANRLTSRSFSDILGARQHSSASQSTPVPRIAALLYPAPDKSYSKAQSLTIKGFVRSVRKQKKIAFLAIGDGSTYQSLQAVLSPEQAQGLSTGAAVSVTGRWIASQGGKQQSHELQVDEVQILGQHEADTYPLQKKYHSHEFLRTIPHLRSRSAVNSLLLRMRSQTISNVGQFFEQEDFVNVHPPLITSSDCEGAGEVFTVQPPRKVAEAGPVDQFFRQQKYLTVSSQLHLEALAASVGKVWTLSPTFRAERSDTPRHLSEFYMLEAEEMFTEDLETVMSTVERLLQSLTQRLMQSRIGEELLEAAESRKHESSGDAVTKEQLAKRWSTLAAGNWPRISYTNAIAQLQEAYLHNRKLFQHNPKWDQGLQAEHEKYLAKTIGQDGPVFVTDYPREIKAFYMPKTPGQPSSTPQSELTVSCFDLVVPDLCEIVGGSLREHQIDSLLTSMADHGMVQSSAEGDVLNQAEGTGVEKNASGTPATNIPLSLQWYVDLRRYGSVQHGGFGLGFDRLLCYLSGVSSIRDMVAFPRWYGRCDA